MCPDQRIVQQGPGRTTRTTDHPDYPAMLAGISELEEVIDEEQAPTMTEEQSEEYRRGLERVVLATQQELYRRAQAAAREWGRNIRPRDTIGERFGFKL